MLETKHRTVRVAAGIMVALTAGAATPALAQGYGYGSRDQRGHASHVVAESQWGNGTVSGAVRPGRHGLQVRLPGGTWIDCVRSCSDTLRRQTIDFWQSNGHNAPGSGRGYLSWQFRY